MSRSPFSEFARRISPIRFVGAWLASRRWRALISGALAVVCLLGGAMIHLEAARNTVSDLTVHYVTKADQIQVNVDKARANLKPDATQKQKDDLAEQEKSDLARAELFYRRATILDSKHEGARYGLAILTARKGDLAQARRIMDDLAAASYGDVGLRANAWVVMDATVRAQSGQISEAEFRKIPARYEKIVAAQPTNMAARETLGKLYLAIGAVDSAMPHLSLAAETKPELYLLLSDLYRGQGKTDQARDSVASAERLSRARLKDKPSDKEIRATLANALGRQKKFEEASQVLEEVLKIHDDEKLREALSKLNCAWAAGQIKEPQLGGPSALKLVSDAIALDPKNIVALQLLIHLSSAGQPDAAQAIEVLEQKLASGEEATWVVHLIIGSQKANAGDEAAALVHLEQAARLNPRAAAALNNLAFLYAQGPEADLNKALQFADSAIKIEPRSAQLRETRGQILIRLERYRDGLTDLEQALPTYARQPELKENLPLIHRSMALAYEKLGDASMAEQHRKLAGPAAAEAPVQGPATPEPLP